MRTVRIRGIYASALTRFFLDAGFAVVDPSPVAADRFKGWPNLRKKGRIDFEIRDTDDRQGVFLEGAPEALEAAADLLMAPLFDAVRRKGEDAEGAFVEIELPYLSKAFLDETRNQVVPTVPHHHRLRIIDREGYLDMMEETIRSDRPEARIAAGRTLEDRLVWGRYRKGMEIGIEHVKIDGKVILLSPGEIIEIDAAERHLVLRREGFSGGGRYDGIDLPTAPGDYAVSRLKEAEWFYTHTYHRSDGRAVGEYRNVNSFIEFYPDRVRYLDLEIDVVRPEGGVSRIIDRERLLAWHQGGVIGTGLKDQAIEAAERLMHPAGNPGPGDRR
jgi:hypothetical protein